MKLLGEQRRGMSPITVDVSQPSSSTITTRTVSSSQGSSGQGSGQGSGHGSDSPTRTISPRGVLIGQS